MKHKGIGDLDPSFLLLVVSEHLRDSPLLLHDHMARGGGQRGGIHEICPRSESIQDTRPTVLIRLVFLLLRMPKRWDRRDENKQIRVRTGSGRGTPQA